MNILSMFQNSSNTCMYGEQCWFRHDDKRLEQEKEVNEKIMNMMEKFTKKIIELENRLEAMKNIK